MVKKWSEKDAVLEWSYFENKPLNVTHGSQYSAPSYGADNFSSPEKKYNKKVSYYDSH